MHNKRPPDHLERRPLFGFIALVLVLLFAGLSVWSFGQTRKQAEDSANRAISNSCRKALELHAAKALRARQEPFNVALRSKGKDEEYYKQVDATNKVWGTSLIGSRNNIEPQVSEFCIAEDDQRIDPPLETLKLYDVTKGDKSYKVARLDRYSPYFDDQGVQRLDHSALEVATRYDTEAEILGRRVRLFLIGVVLLLAITGSIAVNLYFNWRLRSLTKTLRAAARGDVTVRAAGEGDPSELGLLIKEVNATLARIEDHVLALDLAAARASHELLDPLNQAALEIEMSRSLRMSAGVRSALVGVRRRLDQARAGAAGILQMARTVQAASAPLDLTNLVREVAQSVSKGAAEDGFSLTLNLDEGVRIMGSSDHMRTILENLFINARKYSATHGAEVRLSRLEGGRDLTFRLDVRNATAVETSDAGLDLTARFQRGSDVGERDGVGLGLNTVRLIAIRYGLRFGVIPEPGVFTAWLTGPALAG